MMEKEEREAALLAMDQLSSAFYRRAVQIGNHPFIEFAGLMNEYIKACGNAHARGIDFSECSTHSGIELPLRSYELAYIQEKLDCIFCGRIRIAATGDSA